MKAQNGITLVALVITIIILIILTGISINSLVGEQGIITKAQQAKENIQLAQEEELKNLNELYSQLDNMGDSSGSIGDIDSETLQKLIEFKRAITTAITNEGVNTLETDTVETMVGNIGKILQERTKGATATEADILSGKTAWVNGKKITGNRIETSKVKNLIGSEEWETLVNHTPSLGMVQNNDRIAYQTPVHVTEYKYMVLIFNKYNYYTQTIGIGLYDTANPSYSQCVNATNQEKKAWTGNNVNTHTPDIIYLDISNISGEKYPFIYTAGSRYQYIYITLVFD